MAFAFSVAGALGLFGSGGALSGIFGTAAAAGVAYKALEGTSQPNQPNLNTETGQLAEAEANYLPQLLALQSEAESGTGGLIPGFTDVTGQGGTKYYQLNKGYTTKVDQNGQTIYLNSKGNQVSIDKAVDLKKPVPESQAVANFSGESAAQIQGTIQDQLATGELANAQQYDPQFIASALQQEQQLDPNRVAARNALYGSIEQGINTPAVSPVSNEMQRQVGEQVAAGSGLTPEEQAMLDTSVNQAAAARGGTVNAGTNYSTPLTTGLAGEQRGMANAGAGTQWLSSGQTPEDIANRAAEQNISNLSAFYSGQTPESEFRDLSGAGNQPMPQTGNPNLPQLPGNLAQVGTGAAVQNYGMDVQNSLNTPNPWMTGLSTALQIGGIAAMVA